MFQILDLIIIFFASLHKNQDYQKRTIDQKQFYTMIDQSDYLAIATRIVAKLQASGEIAFFAGGWVRDYILQQPSEDIDIVTSASIKKIQQLFPKTIPVGIAFGVVVVVEEQSHFEVATFRKDGAYRDGRHPEKIDLATAQEDAMRRDFTINGLFYDPIKKSLHDFIGGIKDIEKKIIRTIGNPYERLAEDRLRMVRAVRYSARFQFSIEEKTQQAILELAHTLLPATSLERIWQEIKKMSHHPHFDTALLSMFKLELLPTIIPILKSSSLEEIGEKIAIIRRFPSNTPAIISIMELIPYISPPTLSYLGSYFKLSNDEKKFADLYYALRKQFISSKQKLAPIEEAYFYAHRETTLILSILSASQDSSFLTFHNERRLKLKKHIERIQNKTPLIRAKDLMEMGIVAGKEMGMLLKEAEKISINDEIEEKEVILEKIKKSPLWPTHLS